MTSPICTVNGNTTGNGVNVSANSSVTIALSDTTGVKSWSLRCISTDENHVAATITAGLSINQITKTATFTSPNTSNGAALIFESTVNGGLDVNGRQDSSLTTRFGVFVLTSTGGLRIGAFDETLEGDASFGWTSKFNSAVRAAGAAALTPALSGTLPIVVNNSNPAAPVVGINAATTAAAGSMSAADKTKLDEASNAGAANKLVLYGSDGSICTDKLIAGSGNNLVIQSDGMSPITLDGNGSSNLLVPSGIQSSYYKLQSTVTGIARSCPLDWRGYHIAGVESWHTTLLGTCKQAIIDAEAECYVQLDLPHGAIIEYFGFKTKGAGSNPAPGNLPAYNIVRQNMSTLAQGIVVGASDAGGGSYRSTHWTLLDATAVADALKTVDRVNYRYYAQIQPETGTDSEVGFQLDAIYVQYTLPAGFSIGLG